jgi:hypothetical protein
MCSERQYAASVGCVSCSDCLIARDVRSRSHCVGESRVFGCGARLGTDCLSASARFVCPALCVQLLDSSAVLRAVNICPHVATRRMLMRRERTAVQVAGFFALSIILSREIRHQIQQANAVCIKNVAAFHTMKAYGGNINVAPLILNIGCW